MERETMDDRGPRDGARGRGADTGAEQLGVDDQEFSSVEDTGTEPSENPAVDDV
jgi:hypothetical protein